MWVGRSILIFLWVVGPIPKNPKWWVVVRIKKTKWWVVGPPRNSKWWVVPLAEKLPSPHTVIAGIALSQNCRVQESTKYVNLKVCIYEGHQMHIIIVQCEFYSWPLFIHVLDWQSFFFVCVFVFLFLFVCLFLFLFVCLFFIPYVLVSIREFRC